MAAPFPPPSMTGRPPMGAGPLSVPSGNPGAAANGLAQVREAVKILQEALGSLPAGSDPWKAVVSSISSLGKHVAPSDEIPGHEQTVLQNLARNAGKNQALMNVQRSLGAPNPGDAAAAMPGG